MKEGHAGRNLVHVHVLSWCGPALCNWTGLEKPPPAVCFRRVREAGRARPPASGERGRNALRQGCLGRRSSPGTRLSPRSWPPHTPRPLFSPSGTTSGARGCSVRRRAAPAAGQGGRLRTREERSGGLIERNHHRWTWVSWVPWSVCGSSERRRDSRCLRGEGPAQTPHQNLPTHPPPRPDTSHSSPNLPPRHAYATRTATALTASSSRRCRTSSSSSA